MDAAMLLTELRQRGIQLAAEGEGIRVQPASALTDSERAAIRELKRALIDALYYEEIESGTRQPDYVLPSGIPAYVPPGMVSYTVGTQVLHHATPAPLPTLPDPLPPILEDATDIIELAQCGELDPPDKSFVITAAYEVCRLAWTKEQAQKLTRGRRNRLIRLMLDIATIAFKYVSQESSNVPGGKDGNAKQ